MVIANGMKNKTKNILLMLVAVMALSSCAARKKFVYLQDMEMGQFYPIEQKHDPVVHRDDKLSIVVSSKNPELAVPFNIQAGAYNVGEDGRVSTSVPSMKEKGYRVDIEGNIDFPMLGTLHVEGLTISEVTELIKNRIIEGGYINNPLVMVDIMNFKYTVLGAVGSNGVKTADGDRVTLLEAIANAGDLTSNAAIDRVAVIREMGETRQVFFHDLRSKDLFESPCFYLQQNDIVYVEPKYKKRDTEDGVLKYGTLMLSVASTMTSMMWWIQQMK